MVLDRDCSKSLAEKSRKLRRDRMKLDRRRTEGEEFEADSQTQETDMNREKHVSSSGVDDTGLEDSVYLLKDKRTDDKIKYPSFRDGGREGKEEIQAMAAASLNNCIENTRMKKEASDLSSSKAKCSADIYSNDHRESLERYSVQENGDGEVQRGRQDDLPVEVIETDLDLLRQDLDSEEVKSDLLLQQLETDFELEKELSVCLSRNRLLLSKQRLKCILEVAAASIKNAKSRPASFLKEETVIDTDPESGSDSEEEEVRNVPESKPTTDTDLDSDTEENICEENNEEKSDNGSTVEPQANSMSNRVYPIEQEKDTDDMYPEDEVSVYSLGASSVDTAVRSNFEPMDHVVIDGGRVCYVI
jgi:hypothetical protein